jgi:hypothetical protein
MKGKQKLLPIYIGLVWILSAGLVQGKEPIPLTLAANQKPGSKSTVKYEHVHALAMDSGAQTLFLGAHTGLFRSGDRGRTWNKVPIATKHGHLDVMDIAPDSREPNTIYIATHEVGVLKSVDGGRTWKEASSGLGGPDVHGLAIDPNMPFKLHAAVRDKGEGIYRTTDQDQKWIRVDDGPQGEIKVLRSVNIPTGMGGIFLYAGTSTGLQRSPDCF